MFTAVKEDANEGKSNWYEFDEVGHHNFVASDGYKLIVDISIDDLEDLTRRYPPKKFKKMWEDLNKHYLDMVRDEYFKRHKK